MQDNKEKLLDELASTFAMLKASPLHGVGVFAIRNIRQNESKIFSSEIGEWVELSFEEVRNLPAEIQALIENYCLFDEKGYFVPAHGFKSIDLSLCLNHSDNPNLISVDDGAYFIATRDILNGEELTVDYGTICDSKE
jgi:SET domain-containing protein